MSDQPSSWHDAAPAQIPANVYVVQPGDVLPDIAERLGYPGQWRALFEENIPPESRDRISPDALPVGVWLRIPPEWLPAGTAADNPSPSLPSEGVGSTRTPDPPSSAAPAGSTSGPSWLGERMAAANRAAHS
jgi:hypothetical protein